MHDSLYRAVSLHCDLVVVTQAKPRTRRAWHSSRSKVPQSRIPLSQPTAALTARPEPVSRHSASQPSAVLFASKRGGSTKKQVVSAFFSRESPFYAPLTRFLAENWRFPGEDGFTTVYGTSGWQGLAHLPGSPAAGSLPCFYDSREKFVHFGSAEHVCSEPAPVAVKILISRKFCVRMSGAISWPSCGSTPLKLRF
jgi:hypothetical protein